MARLSRGRKLPAIMETAVKRIKQNSPGVNPYAAASATLQKSGSLRKGETLEQFKTYAQAEANRQQRAVTIWNLNRHSPLYVVRDAQQGDSKRDQFVIMIQPTTDRVAADNVAE